LAGVPTRRTGKPRWRDAQIERRETFDTSKLRCPSVQERYEAVLEPQLGGAEKWEDIAAAITCTARDVLGVRAKPGPDAVPEERKEEMRSVQNEARALFEAARECEDVEEGRRLIQLSRQKGRQHRRLVRQATNQQWRGVCDRLQQADASGNPHVFWREMKSLNLSGAPPAQPIRFSPEQLREHFSSIGSKVNNVDEEMLQQVPQIVPVCEELGDCPSDAEIWVALRGMRESAPGPDLVTVSLLKHGGNMLKQKVVDFVREMWDKPPEQWESICHEAEVIALFKKGARDSLDNYRGICLLQIISRLVARIAAKRLSAHVERHQVIATEQWGSRPYRSAVDALFVMSRAMAEAARHDDDDPLVLDTMDIKKAYPNCSRNAMNRSLELIGIPPRLRDILGKLDSLTQYRCRSAAGLSEPYTTLRGCREGCPAAPVKFNVLHHVATAQLREEWERLGIDGSVFVDTLPEAEVWPNVKGLTREKVRKLPGTCQAESKALDVVGYADDTTIVTRFSEADKRRAATCQTYEAWGHVIHPDKWQKLWGSKKDVPKVRKRIRKKEPEPSAFVTEAKVLGCFLESDGGYCRERNNRMSSASTVWRKLKKKLERVSLRNQTKGRMLKSTVLAAMLYGTETRAPKPKDVASMQKVFSCYERWLLLGARGGLKDMRSKLTQTDIRIALDTLSVQFEMDIRLMRYVGHITRMPADRWERRLLFGCMRGSSDNVNGAGKDMWWDRVRKLLPEVMQERTEPWYELAQQGDVWRKILWEWRKRRTADERADTQAARQEIWNKVAASYDSQWILDTVWKRSRPPDGAGTPLEGSSQRWLKQVILAGGLHSNG